MISIINFSTLIQHIYSPGFWLGFFVYIIIIVLYININFFLYIRCSKRIGFFERIGRRLLGRSYYKLRDIVNIIVFGIILVATLIGLVIFILSIVNHITTLAKHPETFQQSIEFIKDPETRGYMINFILGISSGILSTVTAALICKKMGWM